MERRNLQPVLIVAMALVIGFLVALVVFGNGNDKNAAVVTNGSTTTTTATTGTSGATQATTTTTTGTTTSGAATTADCIALWNQPVNRGARTFLINIASQQPIRIHVGLTSDVPPQCLVTVIGNNGDAFVFPEGGGTTFPYAPVASTTDSATLPADQRTTNALEQRDGSLEAH